jgi:hypothetical protein
MERAPQHDKRCENAQNLNDLCEPCHTGYEQWVWDEYGDE